MILVLSKYKDFSHGLAEQIVRELQQECECADTLEGLKISPDLIVTHEEPIDTDLPVIAVGKPPIRLAPLLKDIAETMQRLAGEIQLPGSGLSFSLRQKTLTHSSGKTASLTDKEAQLLHAIATADGISREALLSRVWGIQAELNTHTLETHIYRLRSKLKNLSGNEMISATENGYRIAHE